MKRLFFLLFPFSILAQDGIQFQDLTWDAALAESRKSGKLIFVDAYATWCQPCKALEKYTFTDAGVGQLFNASFVNVRFDMEKYPGLELSEKYTVDLYPTLLFINGQGELVHRGCGALEVNDLINLGQTALNPDQTLKSLADRFDGGERSIELIDSYFEAMQGACQNVNGLIEDFFDGVKTDQLTEEVNWHVLREYNFDLYSREFQFLLANQEQFSKAVGEGEVQDKIFDTFMLTYSEMSESEMALFAIKALKHLATQQDFERRQEVLDYLDFGLGELTEDWELYAKGAVGFLRPEIEDQELIMDISWKFYLFVEDKTKLMTALNWTKQVLDSNEPQPSTIDTYASLLFKIGRKEDAVKFSEQALQLAQSWGEETEHYEFQLKKFKGG